MGVLDDVNGFQVVPEGARKGVRVVQVDDAVHLDRGRRAHLTKRKMSPPGTDPNLGLNSPWMI